MRILRILIIALAFIPAISTQSTAQIASHEDYYLTKTHFGVGLQAGLLSGMGLSVRFHPHARYGFELSGGAFKGGDNLLASIGAEAQYDFDWKEKNRFYGFVGFGYYQNGEEDKNPLSDDDDKLKGPVRAGFGVGYDWEFSTTLILSAELGLTWFSDGPFLPLPQVGISYLFN